MARKLSRRTYEHYREPRPQYGFLGPNPELTLYIISVAVSGIGFIWGLVWWLGGDTEEKRRAGKNGFWISVTAMICYIVLLSTFAMPG